MKTAFIEDNTSGALRIERNQDKPAAGLDIHGKFAILEETATADSTREPGFWQNIQFIRGHVSEKKE